VVGQTLTSNALHGEEHALTVREVAGVVAEVELVEIAEQVLGVHMVERADESALHDREEASTVLLLTSPLLYSWAL